VWFCSFNEIHSKFKTNKIERETMMHINLSHNIPINCIFGAIFFFFLTWMSEIAYVYLD